MKNIFFCLFLLVSSTVFSQEITIQGGRYFVNGQQISTREVKEKIAFNKEALHAFNTGKRKENNGFLLFGLGTAVTISDLVKGLVSDEKYPGAATYVGAGLITVSIPILIGKNRKMHQGIELYNAGLKNSGDVFEYDLSLTGSINGVGLQLRF